MSVKNLMMNIYKRHRIPPQVISYAVWLHHRFNLSHKDIDNLFAVPVSYRAGGELYVLVAIGHAGSIL